MGDGGASDNLWGISSILTNVKEKKFVSGYKQWCADKCLITGSLGKKEGGWSSNIYQFLWCKDCHCGQVQALMSINMESALVKRYEPASTGYRKVERFDGRGLSHSFYFLCEVVDS